MMHATRGIGLVALLCACAHAAVPVSREEPGVVIGSIGVEGKDTRTLGTDAITLTQRGTRRAAHSPTLPDSLKGLIVSIYPVDGCGALHAVDADGIVRPLSEMLGENNASVAMLSAQSGKCTISERVSAVQSALGSRAKAVILYGATESEKVGTDATDATLKLPTLVIDNDAGAVVLERLRTAGKRHERLVLSLSIPPEVRAATQNASEQPGAGSNGSHTLNALQTTLAVVLILLLLAFGTSLYMQYHIRQLEEQLARQRLADARGAVPMDESLLSRLEIVVYENAVDPAAGVAGACSPLSDEALVKNASPPCSPLRSESGGDICPICLEDLVGGVLLNKLPCGHVFHPACVQHWLRTRSPCCPMCKADVRDAFLAADRLVAPVKETRLSLARRLLRMLPCFRSQRSDAPRLSLAVPNRLAIATPHHGEHATYPGRHSLDPVALDTTRSDADISRIV